MDHDGKLSKSLFNAIISHSTSTDPTPQQTGELDPKGRGQFCGEYDTDKPGIRQPTKFMTAWTHGRWSYGGA